MYEQVCQQSLQARPVLYGACMSSNQAPPKALKEAAPCLRDQGHIHQAPVHVSVSCSTHTCPSCSLS